MDSYCMNHVHKEMRLEKSSKRCMTNLAYEMRLAEKSPKRCMTYLVKCRVLAYCAHWMDVQCDFGTKQKPNVSAKLVQIAEFMLCKHRTYANLNKSQSLQHHWMKKQHMHTNSLNSTMSRVMVVIGSNGPAAFSVSFCYTRPSSPRPVSSPAQRPSPAAAAYARAGTTPGTVAAGCSFAAPPPPQQQQRSAPLL